MGIPVRISASMHVLVHGIIGGVDLVGGQGSLP